MSGMAVPLAVRSVLIADEGLWLKPYRDTKGLWTYGVGRLIGADLIDLRISKRIALAMLDEDIEQAVADACAILGAEAWSTMNDARKIATISLLFTLGGPKFAKFHDTIAAIQRGDWNAAAAGVKDSKWARDVDPRERPDVGRDDRVAFMLKEGRLHENYL